jgi:drug/metabolite transporter (DMT)-like permease
MTLPVVVVVLAAAVLHATWNALAHSASDKLVGFVLIDVGYVCGGVLLVGLAPRPDPAAWRFIALSTALQLAYQLTLLMAYRLGDFGQMYPLARGTSPWVTALLSVTLLGRPLPLGQLAGVLTLSAGQLALTFAQGRPGRKQVPALAAAVVTGLLIASYTVSDGVGVRLSGTVLGYVGWEFLLQGLPLPLIVLARRRGALLTELRPEWRRGILGGVLSLIAYGLVVWAQDQAPNSLPGIAALRETSIVLAAVIAARHFHERFGRLRTAASAVVVAGIAVMELVHL